MGLSVGSLAAPAARFEAPRLARPGPGVAVHRGGGRTARRPPAITAVLTAFLPAGPVGRRAELSPTSASTPARLLSRDRAALVRACAGRRNARRPLPRKVVP